MKILPVLLLAAFALSPALLAADKPTIIRLGVPGTGTGGRPVIGGATNANVGSKNLLENAFNPEGIEVKWTYFAGAGPALNEALANGQLDFAAGLGDLPALVHKAKGLNTKWILGNARYNAIYVTVPDGSPARKLTDLKGKRLGLFKGTNLQLAFYNVLTKEGLKESDFKLINISIYDAQAALLSGDLDGYVAGSDAFPLVARNVARIIYDTRGKPQEGRMTNVYVTADFESKYPEYVQKVVNIFLKEAAFIADEANRNENYSLWNKSGTGLQAWKGDLEWTSLKELNNPLIDPYLISHHKRLLNKAIELKLIRKTFDVDAWAETKYQKQGLKDLKLEGFWTEQPDPPKLDPNFKVNS